MNDIPKTNAARTRSLRLSRRTSRRPRSIALGCALALGLTFGAARSAQASKLPMALTSYVDTSASEVHLFYLASDGGVYDLSAPLAQASNPSSWSCASTLPPMTYHLASHDYTVNTGGMMPGSNLAASYDGTTGHLYYMGSDNGLWAADGNPPNVTTAHSVSQMVGSSAPLPTSQANWWCLPSSPILHGACFQGVNNPATIATAGGPGAQTVFYQGTDATLHNLMFQSSGWQSFTIGNGANAINGKGLSAALGLGTEVFFDDAVGNAEAWGFYLLFGGGFSWLQQATFNVDFQGFLGSSLMYQGGNTGYELVGPDPSQTLPALDVANNANATNAWGGASSVDVRILPAGPILNVYGGNATLATYTYYVGSDGQVRTSTGYLLTDRAEPFCNGCVTMPAATSAANTAYTPLTGFFSTADAAPGAVHLFYLGADLHVYTIVISQQSGASPAGSVINITPSSCPTIMN